jgi:protein SCO1/2
LAIGIALSCSAWSYDSGQRRMGANEKPPAIEDVGVTEHLGEKIDLSIPFVDDEGKEVTLAKYMHPGRPLLLALVYFECPNLCNYQINGLTNAFRKMDWDIGDKFDFVAISINSKETPAIAAAKKANYVKSYGRLASAQGWHFLTGSAENIAKIAGQIGFKYKWNESDQQFGHAAVTYAVTPEGKLSRYLYGVEFDPKTIRLSLVEASHGKIGTLADHFVLMCFMFDPTKNKYTLYAFNLMRFGGVLMIILLMIILIPYWRRERKRTAA